MYLYTHTAPDGENLGVRVRLVDYSRPNATNPTQGLVEINYYGIWGTICDDLWDMNDANVICRYVNKLIASMNISLTVKVWRFNSLALGNSNPF